MAKTKGFKTGKNSREIVAIRFAEGHDLHGLEIDVEKRVPVGVLLGAQSGDFARALDPFITRIVRWNLEDDAGEPVPVGREGFDTQFDTTEAGELLRAWVKAVALPLGES